MSRRRWSSRVAPLAYCLLIGGMLGWIIHSHVSGAYRAVPESDSNNHAERTEDRIDSECVGLSGSALAKCQNEIAQVSEENRFALAALEAQVSVARSSFIVMLTSISSVIVTAIGVWYVRDTLRETARANAAANAAVAVTREIGEAQVRAYLSFQAVTARLLIRGREPNIVRWTLTVSTQNSGGSPALSPRLTVRLHDGPTVTESMGEVPANGRVEKTVEVVSNVDDLAFWETMDVISQLFDISLSAQNVFDRKVDVSEEYQCQIECEDGATADLVPLVTKYARVKYVGPVG